MEIEKGSLAGVPLLKIAGDIDHLVSDEFDRAVNGALDGSGRLLLDLAGCDYLDSGGISVLLTVVRDLGAGGLLGVLGCGDNVLRLFQIVGLTALPTFRVFSGPEEALEALDGAYR